MANMPALEDAMVWFLYERNQKPADPDRPTRRVIDGDLSKIADTIHALNQAYSLAVKVAYDNGDAEPNYVTFKRTFLNRQMRTHKWHRTTRNTYSSIMSIHRGFTAPGKKRDPKKTAIIAKMKPGVLLCVQPWIPSAEEE